MRKIRTDTTPKKKKRLVAWNFGESKLRGSSFNRQMQRSVYNAYAFCKEESENNCLTIDIHDYVGRVAVSFGISRQSVTKYAEIGENGGPCITPGKLRPRISPLRSISDSQKEAIRNIIYIRCERRLFITCEEVYKDAQNHEEYPFKGSLSTFRKVMRDLGFRYQHRDGRRYLLEEPNIILLRHNFLKKYVDYYRKNANFIFQDETWIFKNGVGKRKELADSDRRSVSHRLGSMGGRYLIAHCGGKQGFLEGAKLIESTAKKPQPGDDYHGDMDGKYFKKYIQNKVIPELVKMKNPVFVTDNAPSHTKQEDDPTSKTKKAELQSWLTAHKIPYKDTDLRSDLWALCKAYMGPKTPTIQKLFEEAKVPLLFTPPYHCFYNPIEMVWAIAKGYFDKHVGRENKWDEPTMKGIWDEALNHVKPEFWKHCVVKTETRILFDYIKEVEKGEVKYEIPVFDSDSAEDWVDVPAAEPEDEASSEWMQLEEMQSRRQLPFGAENRPVQLDDEDDLGVEPINFRSLSIVVPNEVTSSPKRKKRRRLTSDTDKSGQQAELLEAIASINEIFVDEPSPEHLRAILKTLGDKTKQMKLQVGLEISVEDLYSLLPETYLNDKVIDAYFKVMERRAGPHILAFNAFFFTALMAHGYEHVSKWTRNVNIFSKQKIMIPVFLRRHWCICEVDIAARSIIYYDSLHRPNPTCLEEIKTYLEREETARLPAAERLPWARYEKKGKNVPKQMNSYDCGVFICAYMNRVCTNKPLDFNQQMMTHIRHEILNEILHDLQMSSSRSSYHHQGDHRVATGPHLIQSADYHQGSSGVFPPGSALNAQCTSISIFALWTLAKENFPISSSTLNDILKNGDQLHSVSLEERKKRGLTIHPSFHLCADEVISDFEINSIPVHIDLTNIAEGQYNDPNLLDTLKRSIDSCTPNNIPLSVAGYLFIGLNKTMSFRICHQIDRNCIVMFNSHSVDEQNRFSPHESPNSKARLFQCDSSESLAKLLLCEYEPSASFWQIIAVTFVST